MSVTGAARGTTRGRVVVVAVLLLAALPAAGQTVIRPREKLDFDRPEAWAMKYFTSVSLMTGLGAARHRDPGSVEVGVEVASIPSLSRAERTVGFDGTKPEDLNKVPVLVRPRVTVGLPGKVSATVGWVPPARVNGVRPNLVSVAFERPLVEAGRWGLGARLYGQVGTVEGDFTCPEDVLRFEPGSPENLYGCRARSSDETDQRYAGFELSGSYSLEGRGEPRLHLGAAINYLDMEFQVDARTFGVIDRTHLLADGVTWSVDGGASWLLAGKTRLGVDLFYTPLSVDRPTVGHRRTEGLFNVRLVVGYRVR